MRYLLFLSLLLALCGCDRQYIYQFYVHNDMAGEVSLTYSSQDKDSTVIMAPGAQRLILEMEQLGKGKSYFAEGDTIWWIRTLEATDASGNQNTVHLRVVDQWEYSPDKDHEIYNLKLNSDKF